MIEDEKEAFAALLPEEPYDEDYDCATVKVRLPSSTEISRRFSLLTCNLNVKFSHYFQFS